MTRRIGFFIFDGFQILDAAGPIAAFEIGGARGQGAYRLSVLAKHAGPVASSSGATMAARAFADAPRLDTLVVAGGFGTYQALDDQETLAYLRQAASDCRRVASVCSGAFLLAEAGLLDGKRATTHWSRSRQFAQRYPDVRLEPGDIVYVPYSPYLVLARYANLVLDTFVRTVGVNEGAYAINSKAAPISIGVNITP